MTVSTTISKSGPYAGAGTTGPFTVNFRFLENSHLRVVRTDAAGLDTNLALTADYAVTGAGAATGAVTLVAALAAGQKLTILRNVPTTQEADYVQNDAFPAESHERALDKLTMLTQQNAEGLGRALLLPPSVASSVSAQLPVPLANTVFGWDEAGTALKNFDSQLLATIVAYGFSQSDVFTGDGTTTSWTLTYSPGLIGNLDVSIGGVVQLPGADYQWTNGLVFTTTVPVPAGVKLLVRYAQALPAEESALRLGLAAAGGSALVGYLPAGDGGVVGTTESKLRQLVARSEYASSGAFDAAKAGKPNIDGGGNFDAPVTPSGEPTQIQLANAVQTVAAGPRDAIAYAGPQSVRVFRNFATMGGFRFRGHYTKGRAPTFPMPAVKSVTAPGDLGGMTAKTDENWYAVFACANDGDATASLKMMPFLRAGMVSGSNIPLTRAGEGIYLSAVQSYAWTAANNLAGTDCLVISEAGGFSGRVASITANSNSQITLDSIGSTAEGDYLLPAPPGFDHYVYLGSFYFDTAEVRNIYDTGTLVKAKMIYLVYPNNPNGAVVAPGDTYNCAGYICPLATAVVIDSQLNLATTSVGKYGEYYDPDGSNHIVQSKFVYKAISGVGLDIIFDNVQVPFLYPQKFNFYNAGDLAVTRYQGQLQITGWIEP